MKLQIIGYSGSGKSTLAIRLALFYRIPVLHLDNVKFYGNWEERTAEEQNLLVRQFMTDNENWVIDGNYFDVAPERLSLADVTVCLAFNRFYCYRMCRRRYKNSKGKARESCPCPEKFDWEFRRWILFDGRTAARARKMRVLMHLANKTHYIFKTKRQLDAWLISEGIHE